VICPLLSLLVRVVIAMVATPSAHFGSARIPACLKFRAGRRARHRCVEPFCKGLVLAQSVPAHCPAWQSPDADRRGYGSRQWQWL
jgi:hypothetical protein